MKAMAVVAIHPYEIEYKTVDVPDPEETDLVIRLTHSWISNGTEGSFIRGERIAGDTSKKKEDKHPFPMVPGYQKVGLVEWVGRDVPDDIQIGETVFATISNVKGMFFETGGHISPSVVHYSQIWRIPEKVSPLSVSGLVLTQVGYNCGIRPALKRGDAAVILGDGMVGHWAAQTLAHRGARIALIGRHIERLSRYDFKTEDLCINSSVEDTMNKLIEWAPQGIQTFIDTVGSVSAIEAMYPALKHSAHIVSAGFHGANGFIDIQAMRAKELTLHAPAGWSHDRMCETLEWIRQGALQTEHLITHHFHASDAAVAFDLILSRREPVLGVILDWE